MKVKKHGLVLREYDQKVCSCSNGFMAMSGRWFMIKMMPNL
jgi:hypothetical protein